MNLDLAVRILDPVVTSDALYEIQAAHEARHESEDEIKKAIYGAIREAREVACQSMRKELLREAAPIWAERKRLAHFTYEDGSGEFKEESFADWTCPNCGEFVGEQFIKTRHTQKKSNYCHNCGMKIDWSAVAVAKGERNGIKQNKD